ncbi:MAG: 50S ribosomal protein L32 [Dehalococcoidales bacterium]|nr:50S ribosomal protein L32 [Dehalococcoidales bacterium]MDP6632213.1 50S ribosomal protein L32 [Dehalococcoidales bacterium]MDP7525603.1 50S ribosomal protein L32 [Dehalococcoidales bacterium]
MGALPKRKYAKARRGKRREHLGISTPTSIDCPQCGSPKLPHQVCRACGSYKGREVIEVKSSASESS